MSWFFRSFVMLIGSFMVMSAVHPANPDLPEPYNTVEVLPFDAKGHFIDRQAKSLNFLVPHAKAEVVIEIGSYLGCSTRHTANLLPAHGKVYAVDHWLGDTNWYKNPSFKDEQPYLYQKFLSNVIHTGLCDKIVPVKMTSMEASVYLKEMGVKPDLIFVDGSHDYDSVYEDLTAWYPFVQDSGVMSGDDYYGGEPEFPVKLAVDKFAEENNLKVGVLQGWVWYYMKK